MQWLQVPFPDVGCSWACVGFPWRNSTMYKAKNQRKIEDCSRTIPSKQFSAFHFVLFRKVLWKGIHVSYIHIGYIYIPSLFIYFLLKKKNLKDWFSRIHPFLSQWKLAAYYSLWGVISFAAVVALMNCTQLMLWLCSLSFMKNTK